MGSLARRSPSPKPRPSTPVNLKLVTLQCQQSATRRTRLAKAGLACLLLAAAGGLCVGVQRMGRQHEAALVSEPRYRSLAGEWERKLSNSTAAVATSGGDTCTAISYEAQFNMVLCATTQGRSNAALGTVTEAQVRTAVMSLEALGSPQMDAVRVGFTTFREPYKCPTPGTTQWTVSVNYAGGSAGSTRRLSTSLHVQSVVVEPTVGPTLEFETSGVAAAVLQASDANDWVVYSAGGSGGNATAAAFRTVFYAAVTEAAELPAGVLSYDDIQVVSSGWIARFGSSEGVVPPGALAFGTPTFMNVGMQGNQVWPAWGWVLFVVAALAAVVPFGMFVLKKRTLEREEEELADGLIKIRKEEGLDKLHGPEFGITNLDFDGDADGDPYTSDPLAARMASEYMAVRAAAAVTRPTHRRSGGASANNASAGGGGGEGGAAAAAKGDASAAAWANVSGAVTEWTSPTARGAAPRRFDIDDHRGSADFDFLRRVHPQYSFDNS